MPIIHYLKSHLYGKHSLKKSFWVNTVFASIINIIVSFPIANFLGFPIKFSLIMFVMIFAWSTLGTIICCLQIIKREKGDDTSNYRKFWAVLVILLLMIVSALLIQDILF